MNRPKLVAMVIDDQPMMRSIVRGVLKRINIIDVIEAESGNGALEYLRAAETMPSFIICDLHMNDGQGSEFANAMRLDKQLRTHKIPIILLTGEEDEMVHDMCLQVGAVSILLKPCSLPQIATAVSKIVGYDVLNKAAG
jgi:CheY-like chemotaxis protein